MMACQNLFYLCTLLCIVPLPLLTLAEEEIGSPLRIAQCRAHCILKFSQDPQSQRMCFQHPDCFMCWENCQLLQANFPIWGGICSEPGICVELVGHDASTGRAQQSEDFLLDTHRAIAVELETSPPDPSVLTAGPDVAKLPNHVDSNEIPTGAAHTRMQPITPHKIDMLAEKQQIEIFIAVGAAFGVFVLVLVVLVYASCRHSDVLSYPRPNGDIFSFKPAKKVDSRFPKDFVPILTLVTENISKRTTNARSTETSDKPTVPKNECSHIPVDSNSSVSSAFKHSLEDATLIRDVKFTPQSYCDRSMKNGYTNRSNIS